MKHSGFLAGLVLLGVGVCWPAHGQSTVGGTDVSKAPLLAEPEPEPPDDLVCELRPERRYYPKQNQWISEPAINRGAFEDIYIYYHSRNQNDEVQMTVYVNPFISAIWAGWIIMILGGVLALVPFGGNRVGLAE